MHEPGCCASLPDGAKGRVLWQGFSEKWKWKIPVKLRHMVYLSKAKCVHWFLSSIGWQWNLGRKQLCAFSCRSDSSGGTAGAPMWGADFEQWILHAFGPHYPWDPIPASHCLSCLRPRRGASPALHSSKRSVSAARLAVITEGPSTLEFASLPCLTELTSANLQNTA